MQALNRTMTPGVKARSRRPDADVLRITGFAEKFLSADNAALVYVANARLSLDRASVEQRLCDLVVGSGKSVAVSDVATDRRFQQFQRIGGTVTGFLGVPIHDAEGAAIGALYVTTEAPRIWSRKDRELLGFLSTELDVILQLREALKTKARVAAEQSLIAREYHHRIRNAYSVSSALIVLTGAQSSTVQSLIETASAQLAVLADAHTAIGFKNEAAYLSTLLDGALKPYAFSGAAISIKGPTVEIAQDKVVSLALIVNELATNSIKHGALGRGGRIDLSWAVRAGVVTLRWQETMRETLSTQPERAGSFGGTMVDLSVAQLGAKIERSWNAAGLDVQVRFPL